jgi:hypothetical protein
MISLTVTVTLCLYICISAYRYLRTAKWIFMKVGMVIIPLEPTQKSYFSPS